MHDSTAGLRLAVGTLTVVPVGTIADPTREHARWAMVLAPVAALPVAVAVGAVVALGHWATLPTLLTAALAVAVIAAGTRAMHLDGLADTVDGLGAGWTRERALEVMRSGDVGPMGVAALLLVLLAQVAALTAIVDRPQGWLVAGVAVVASRASTLLTCRVGMPSARPGGLGAVVAGSVPTWVAGLGGLVVAALLSAAVAASRLSPAAGVVAVVLAAVAVGILLRTCRRVFGGVTGDVMGAAIEVAFTVILIVLSSGRW
ncbi:adenosylcobinamide-GDP ribazoletransferase [Janibacter sp. HTCC2649]|uniref:adenosylcobinamide-GDP ribazoletransferase n=1 Tax=Janibacter sp. HTCC2649 TaxID=313589 RepID=UPI00032205A3|nr:adenosylcobinamide-GDP ribazoletransferase [Janibacter sp. HTCC2649]